MLNKTINILLILVVSVLFYNCTKSTACLQLTTINAKAKFQTINDSLIAKDTTPAFMVIDYDTLRFVANTNLIQIPINSNADSMRLVFKADTNSSKDHVVEIKYSKELHFVSKECGYNYFYEITNFKNTGNLFEKVELISNNINDNDGQVHLVFSF